MILTKTLTVFSILFFSIAFCSTALAQAEVPNPVFPFWKIKGNSGINSSTDFIGTTNSADLVLKANNIEGLRVTTTGALLATGNGGTTPASGSGIRLMWVPGRGAFRTGYVDGTQWDNANIGIYSTAFGNSSSATGGASFAAGDHSLASGPASTALCGYDTASGNYSFAAGIRCHASGFVSIALGDAAKASGLYSMALGVGTQATDYVSLATGFSTVASGRHAATFGNRTTASGENATAMGENTFALSGYETTIGRWNTDYTPFATTAWNTADRLFVIGNGTSAASRSDALVVLKNGNTGIGFSTPTTRLDVNGKTRTTTFQMTNGAANGALLRSDAAGNATWATMASLGLVTGTLDNAYDYGGAGAGRTIIADAGAVTIQGNDGFVAHGNIGNGTIPATGIGARMMWYPRKAAFRAGYSSSAQWDDANTGLFSTAFGNSAVASGYYSFAAGSFTTASAMASVAFGDSSTAYGDYSFAAGDSTVASGTASFAVGSGTKATANYSTSGGYYSIASGTYSIALGARDSALGLAAVAMGSNASAEGNFSIAMGNNARAIGSSAVGIGSGVNALGTLSTAMGSNTTASGSWSTAMGVNSVASGERSVAIGPSCIASGDYSLAIGGYNTASGVSSAAFGPFATASGENSAAFGYNTTASGETSTAFGSETVASGKYSTTIGESTYAKSAYETVVGRWNTNYVPASTTTWSATDRLFTIGKGTSSAARSDALVVLKNGNVGIGVSAPSATLDVVGTVEMFGDWATRTEGTNYQAATDGFVMAWATSSSFAIYTDGNASPTTKRLEAQGNTSNAARPNLMCPVKKGDYYRVETISGNNPTIWWMPLGQ